MIYDLIIVGGGINGTGIARDAAGRGLKVLLCEQDDLASHTSSASTKLIHGGLRYLEHYDFCLVRKSLQEREVLLRAAPHIIWPLRFVMPYVSSLRPAWMIRLGLFLYDHLANRSVLLPKSHSINLQKHPTGRPLKESLKKGFVYSDAWVQDSRLVVLNARDAADKGATILTRTKLVSAERQNNVWECRLHSTIDNNNETIVKARVLVNAAGPWVGDLLNNTLKMSAKNNVRLIKGSHIITRRLFEHDYAYIFQNPDKRIVFAIPYETDFTLIGTTDVEYHEDPSVVKISQDEINYLCDSVNRYFEIPVNPEQIVWSYAGVRPLQEEESDNPSDVTRDYQLELDTSNNQAPLLSVFGGKITTYRKLAEETMEKLQTCLDFSEKPWTAHSPLPGGDIQNADFTGFLNTTKQRYPWLPPALAERYARAYGTRIDVMIGNANQLATLGQDFGNGVYEAEVRYLMQYEWAMTADDILWRRSKLGLHVKTETIENLTTWLKTLLEKSNDV
jgi:glycerol-3-phosphate dehydrogenase